MRVEFIEATSEQPLVPAVKKNLDSLEGYGKIGLVSTLQYAPYLKKVEKYLEQEGKQIYREKGTSNCKYPGQILGCDVSSTLKVEKKVDCFLYIGTGRFHPLGILRETNKPVFILNPFSEKMNKLTEEDKEEYEKRRIMAISKAKEAEDYGILVSVKPGQYRLSKGLEVKSKLERKGKNAFIFLFDTLEHEEMTNFRGIDAWINTACPRIIEDKFKKPVINADEINKLF